MLYYAREDTHYLLYIFDRLRNALISKGDDALPSVIQRSQEIALRTYEKDIVTESSYLNLVKKYNLVGFSDEQLSVLRSLFEWRDKVAREEDESVRFVLPNHMLLRLADLMPVDAVEILKNCHPVPPLVRLATSDLALMIASAKKTPVDGRAMWATLSDDAARKKEKKQSDAEMRTATREIQGNWSGERDTHSATLSVMMGGNEEKNVTELLMDTVSAASLSLAVDTPMETVGVPASVDATISPPAPASLTCVDAMSFAIRPSPTVVDSISSAASPVATFFSSVATSKVSACGEG